MTAIAPGPGGAPAGWRIRVATFNVCHGTRGRGTPVDLEALVAACRSLDADVVALQEADAHALGRRGPSQAAVVAKGLGFDHVYAVGSRARGHTFGNALLTRGDIRDVAVLPLHGHVRPGRRDRRGAVLATLTIDGLAVSTAVTHLSIGVRDNLPQQHRVVDALVARSGPLLLVGDFNRRTSWLRPGLQRAGLDLAVDDAPTQPRTDPQRRIDHVAVHGLTIEAVTVVDTGTSDHCALVAELSA